MIRKIAAWPFLKLYKNLQKGKTPLGIGARPPEQQRFDQKHALPKTSAGLARSACLWLRGSSVRLAHGGVDVQEGEQEHADAVGQHAPGAGAE